jgi:hypothetical protein
MNDYWPDLLRKRLRGKTAGLCAKKVYSMLHAALVA